MASTAVDPVTHADRRQRARVDRRRDGDDDLPHRALDRRARRDGLLGRALRPERRDGRAGGDRPVPPRLGAGRDGAPAREVGRPHAARRRVRDERPLRRRHPPAGHLRLQAGVPRRDARRLRDHDRAPRRRRRAAARLGRVRQHRDLPGGHPPAVAAALRPRRAGRDGLRGAARERAHPAHDARRPRGAGGRDDRRRARAAGARPPVRHRAARRR